MCGICGILNGDGKPVDRNLLVEMNGTLKHRGPDDEGFYMNGHVGLGHRRLSIIDLHTGHQPILNEDDTIAIVFNGEIYNFSLLKRELEAKGHLFKTKTDTEVILHGYEEWGVRCVERLRGMFAFAIWDQNNETLFMARDRLGIKPLYYFSDSTKLAFASELKAIIEDRTIPRDINLEALSDYFSFGYIPSPKSIFRKIHKLPAGHYLLHRRNSTSVMKYWDIAFNPDPCVSEDGWRDRIIEALEESIRIRLISDVPLGAFLSGGIDSSLVVALMTQLMNKPVVTNSLGFSIQAYDELAYARETSALFNTQHNEYVVSPDAVDVVDRLSWFFDEPFADSSAIPTYYVSKMARRNVTVALSGDGGDENFAGYRRYFYDRLENQIRSVMPERFRARIIRSLAGIYPKADRLPQYLRAKTLLTNLSHDPVYGYFNTMSHFLPEMKQRLFSRDLKNSIGDYHSIEVFRRHYEACDTDDPLSRTQYVDFHTYLVDDILTKVDRASMANSLEVRVPVLDHEFVECIAGIPSELKLKGRQAKYIFKRASERLLPDAILNRRKMGFVVPVGQWLKKELQPLVRETILGEEFRQRGLFDARYVEWLWKQHVSGLRDFTQPLWALLSFELWAKRFL